ncbi:hypothetical protein [Salegentibacter salinarum]|uniref:hypothetical protein n=1 Tax=Salegentibacter salinarum TaxID=447422 RepID=UPI001E2B35C3|nr:hypothetical protein [Salegentibacter salinarum]
MNNHYLYGGGYAKKMWVDSEVISFLKEQSFNNPVYSNGIELGKLHLRKDFKLLPGKNDRLKLNNLKEKICEGEAYIVFFNKVNWRNYLVNAETLVKTFKKDDIICLEDGFVIKRIIAE